MIKSTFTARAMFPSLLLIMVAVILFFVSGSLLGSDSGTTLFIAILVLGFLIFIMVWLLIGEIRTKLTLVIVEKDLVTVARWWGAGSKRVYYFSELDGFKTSFLPSDAGEFEYLYLVRGNKKIAKLSTFYHANYNELKHAIASRTKNLGEEHFSFWRELKEVFE